MLLDLLSWGLYCLQSSRVSEQLLEKGKYSQSLADHVLTVKARSCGLHGQQLPRSL